MWRHLTKAMNESYFFYYIVTGERCKKRYTFNHIGSHVFAIEWRHDEWCTSWPWPTFSRSRILKSQCLKKDESYRKMLWNYFFIGWYLPSNGTIADIVFCDRDLNFQGPTFQVAIFASISWKIKNITIAIRWKVRYLTFFGSRILKYWLFGNGES